MTELLTADTPNGFKVSIALEEMSLPYHYQREVRRLFGVLDRRLAAHTFLTGEYSIADIAYWSWVQGHDWSGVSLEGP